MVKIYRRHIILDYPNRFPEGIFYEDNAIGNSWMLRAKHFEYLQEPLYYYYQHEASTVHTITKKRCEDRMEAARNFNSLIPIIRSWKAALPPCFM